MKAKTKRPTPILCIEATGFSLIIILSWLTEAVRLLKRLHYLEEFLRICSWCRKVDHNGEWMLLENYFSSKFATKTSHAMCPECEKREAANFNQPT